MAFDFVEAALAVIAAGSLGVAGWALNTARTAEGHARRSADAAELAAQEASRSADAIENSNSISAQALELNRQDFEARAHERQLRSHARIEILGWENRRKGHRLEFRNVGPGIARDVVVFYFEAGALRQSRPVSQVDSAQTSYGTDFANVSKNYQNEQDFRPPGGARARAEWQNDDETEETSDWVPM